MSPQKTILGKGFIGLSDIYGRLNLHTGQKCVFITTCKSGAMQVIKSGVNIRQN